MANMIEQRQPQGNIGLPGSRLSHFDVLIIVPDQLDPVSQSVSQSVSQIVTEEPLNMY